MITTENQVLEIMHTINTFELLYKHEDWTDKYARGMITFLQKTRDKTNSKPLRKAINASLARYFYIRSNNNGKL
jgi:hypothetical protein